MVDFENRSGAYIQIRAAIRGWHHLNTNTPGQIAGNLLARNRLASAQLNPSHAGSPDGEN
jgi:hypothetical protein